MIEPLRIDFEVGCDIQHAFEVWTARIGLWWPADHTVTGEEGLEVRLEGRVGGRIYERTATGTEHDWARSPCGSRRAASATCGTYAATDPRRPRWRSAFLPAGENRTRVEIEHRGWERLGAEDQAWRDRNLGGWRTLLPHFIRNAESSRRDAAAASG